MMLMPRTATGKTFAWMSQAQSGRYHSEQGRAANSEQPHDLKSDAEPHIIMCSTTWSIALIAFIANVASSFPAPERLWSFAPHTLQTLSRLPYLFTSFNAPWTPAPPCKKHWLVSVIGSAT
eukprot:1133438-Pelagomonas_calceolata.AAC.4